MRDSRILLVSDKFARDVLLDGAAMARLERLGTVCHLSDASGEDVILSRLPESSALILAGWSTRMPWLGPERLDECPRLGFVGCGQDNHWNFLDLDACAARGIAAVDASGAMGWTVAEFGLGMLLSCLRRLPRYHSMLAGGSWFTDWCDDSAEAAGGLLRGSHVGIVGMGRIGQALVKMLQPFGCVIDVWSSYLEETEANRLGVRRRGVLEMAADASVLFVVTQSRTDTRGLVDRSCITALHTGATVIVLGRASTIDMTALAERAAGGELTVGIDVWDEPPGIGHPLLGLPNVVHTPHVAGRTKAANRQIFAETTNDLERFLAGEAPRWGVPAELARRVSVSRCRPTGN